MTYSNSNLFSRGPGSRKSDTGLTRRTSRCPQGSVSSGGSGRAALPEAPALLGSQPFWGQAGPSYGGSCHRLPSTFHRKGPCDRVGPPGQHPEFRVGVGTSAVFTPPARSMEQPRSVQGLGCRICGAVILLTTHTNTPHSLTHSTLTHAHLPHTCTHHTHTPYTPHSLTHAHTPHSHTIHTFHSLTRAHAPYSHPTLTQHTTRRTHPGTHHGRITLIQTTLSHTPHSLTHSFEK